MEQCVLSNQICIINEAFAGMSDFSQLFDKKRKILVALINFFLFFSRLEAACVNEGQLHALTEVKIKKPKKFQAFLNAQLPILFVGFCSLLMCLSRKRKSRVKTESPIL